jgi:hypothetical protein
MLILMEALLELAKLILRNLFFFTQNLSESNHVVIPKKKGDARSPVPSP